MPASDVEILRRWQRGHQAAAKRAPPVFSQEEAIRIALSLIEVAWPVIRNDLNQRLHEDAAQPVRELWRQLAHASGALRGPSRVRSRRS